MDKQIINSAVAGGISLLYSYFGEGMAPFDIKALTQAGLIAGSYMVGEAFVKPFLLPHVEKTHNALLKSVEEHIFDAVVPGLAYALGASQLGISTGFTTYDFLRGMIPSVLSSPVHTAVLSFFPNPV
jgi:uncharacterized membrane protein